MNRFLKVVTVVVLMLMVAVPFAAAADTAQDSAGASQGDTIVEIAVNDGRFDTLVAAVQAAGLVDALSGGSWTVFAPTDSAFAKLGLNEDNIADSFSQAELTDILLYHVLPTPVSSFEAKASTGDITMGNGEDAGLKVFDGSLYVNDDAKVIIPDINASNGVIHVVDSVILGPWPRTEGEEMPAAPAAPMGNTIVDIAVNDGRFDTLVAAVQAAGLADELSSGSWTVFAPTDSAFAKLGLNADNIADAFSPAELTNVLLYHVLTSPVSSYEAKASTGDITMANGQQAGLKVFAGDLYVNDDAKVIIPDITASNGVIHVVDTVIQGPWPK